MVKKKKYRVIQFLGGPLSEKNFPKVFQWVSESPQYAAEVITKTALKQGVDVDTVIWNFEGDL